ncbi:TetR/AcrR family transcriptional regulator [Streptomyces hypolithicus]
MATAREALLEAASTALAGRPWPGVRMVDVAAAAAVSRQTLYNEFGSKDGLARALVRRAADGYLAGVDRALTDPAAGFDDRLVSVAEWTVAAARSNALVRALLTGCWGEDLPAPHPARFALDIAVSPVPAQRRADAGAPAPGELAATVCRRAQAGARTSEEAADLGHRCELAVRLALSYVVAPTGSGEDFVRLLHSVIGGRGSDGRGSAGGNGGTRGLSWPSPRAGDR